MPKLSDAERGECEGILKESEQQSKIKVRGMMDCHQNATKYFGTT